MTPTKRILVVDDDNEIADSLRYLFESEGYEVATEGDGKRGLERAERDHPDVIILDIMLPKRSGFMMLEQLRNSGFSSPVVVITAHESRSYHDRAMHLGAELFIRKPFQMRQMFQSVEALLHQ